MKGKFREVFYLILSIFFLCKLILFSVLSPMPKSISYFLILALLGFGTLLFFKKFELEKNDNFMKNISLKMQENTETYLNEKEFVDTMVDIIYDSLPKGTRNSLALIVNRDEDYIIDYFYNLQKFAKTNKMAINELTKFQKGACLIDALSSSTVWVFQSPNKDEDSLRKLYAINVELAIHASLLLCGFTLEDINNNPDCTLYIKIIVFEAITYNSLGDTMIISIFANFLESFCNDI